jgi:hypothetical protein
MTSTIFLSSPTTYTYDNVQGQRTIQVLRQLSAANPVHAIKRLVASEITGYLVAKDWWDAKVADFAAVVAAVPGYSLAEKDATFLSRNLSVLMDLLNGVVQTSAQADRAAMEGLSINGFAVFSFVASSSYFVDDSDRIAMEPNTKKQGVVLGYLIHPKHYAALAGTPTAGSYAGTGDGTISVGLNPGTSVLETLTFTATSATSFTVSGTVSGALGTATVGVLFTAPGFTATITDGATAFVGGDLFTVESLAPIL